MLIIFKLRELHISPSILIILFRIVFWENEPDCKCELGSRSIFLFMEQHEYFRNKYYNRDFSNTHKQGHGLPLLLPSMSYRGQGLWHLKAKLILFYCFDSMLITIFNLFCISTNVKRRQEILIQSWGDHGFQKSEKTPSLKSLSFVVDCLLYGFPKL